MSKATRFTSSFPGRILLVGFGSIGQGVLPLILRHIGIAPERITIVTAEDRGSEEAAEFGVKFIKERLTRENFRRVLDPLLGRGDFLLNVSVDVSSIALIKLCWEKGAMYLDTCIEPWPGGYTDPDRAGGQAHQLRAARGGAGAARRQRARARPPCSPTAPTRAWCRTSSSRRCSTSPPTPDVDAGQPATRADWARARAAARGQGDPHRRARHAGRQQTRSSRASSSTPGRSTASSSEGCQPAETGLGHARAQLPARRQAPRFRLRRGDLPDAAGRGHARAHLDAARRGTSTAFCITHSEAISIADYFTVREGAPVAYRPTVHYAYHPCDCGGDVGARVRRPQLPACRSASAS